MQILTNAFNFFSQFHLSAIYSILLASVVGFGISMSLNSLYMQYFTWRVQVAQNNSNPVWLNLVVTRLALSILCWSIINTLMYILLLSDWIYCTRFWIMKDVKQWLSEAFIPRLYFIIKSTGWWSSHCFCGAPTHNFIIYIMI